MSSKTIGGGCLCGAVRYTTTGAPYNVTHCHCLDCRRSSGAAFVTWASFRRNEFQWINGKPREVSWEGRLRGFCSHCGTSLTFMTEADAEEIDITVASFDDPAVVTPVDHIWVEDRLPWIHLADGLPAHPQNRPGYQA